MIRGDGQVIDNAPGGVSTARSMASPWVERLLMLHRQVRDAVMESGRVGSGARNAKGDDVKLFDLVANDATLAALRKLQLPVVVDSKKSGCQEIGSGTPRHRLVLDPLDGSDNWARGLPLSALSCAVLPVDAPLPFRLGRGSPGRAARAGHALDSAQGLRRLAWERPA